MARSGRPQSGGDVLLDWVRRSEVDGPLLGAVLATYGLSMDQPDFFSQDFLPTLLGLGGVRDRGYGSPLTLDRTLADSGVSLVYDARAVEAGARPTLRVDMVPIGHRVHHAKVILIHRHDRIRLIVGSANLTHEGFRRQREAAVVLDFHEDGRLPPVVLIDALERWEAVLGDAADENLRRVLKSAASRAREWSAPAAKKDEMLPRVVFGGGPTPLWREFVDAWPEGEPVCNWNICSPFWPEVEHGSEGSPFEAIAAALRAKKASLGDCTLEIVARASAPDDHALPLFPFALVQHLREKDFPVHRGQVLPARLDAAPEEVPEGKATENRELHAKWIVMAGPETVLALVGSANFTRRGLGSLRNPASANIEAGVLLRSPRGRWSPEAWRPPIRGQAVDWAACTASGLGKPPDEEAVESDWPVFIATIDLAIRWDRLPEPDGELSLRLRSPAPDEFYVEILSSGGDDPVGARLPCSGRTTSCQAALSPDQVRSVLARRVVRIAWNDRAHSALFPINVREESKAGMPSVLGAKPTEEQLLAYFHGRVSQDDLLAQLENQARQKGATVAEPATAIDVDRLRQLQNYVIREFVESLYGLSRTVQEASHSPRAAEQALLGDLSPSSLAEQVVRAMMAGKRSPTAAAFQLVELIRVVGEVVWPAPTDQNQEALAAYEQVRERALARLFAVAAQAGEVTGFEEVLEDREFSAFVRAMLPQDLSYRWGSMRRRERSSGPVPTKEANA